MNEDKEEFRTLLRGISSQIRGDHGSLVISEGQTEIKFSKEVDIIYDYLNINTNEKRIINKLYNILKLKVVEDTDEFMKLSMCINDYMEELIFDEEYDLILNKNVDIVDLMKNVGLGFNYETENIIENFLEYVKISEKLLGIKVFFFVNLKKFFSDNELINIYNQFLLSKTKLVILESSHGKIIDERERIRIFDADLCEL